MKIKEKERQKVKEFLDLLVTPNKRKDYGQAYKKRQTEDRQNDGYSDQKGQTQR